MAQGIGLARVPAALFVVDSGKTAHPDFAFSAQAFQRSARFASLDAGVGGLAANLGDILVQRHAIAQFFQARHSLTVGFFGGFHRLGEAVYF